MTKNPCPGQHMSAREHGFLWVRHTFVVETDSVSKTESVCMVSTSGHHNCVPRPFLFVQLEFEAVFYPAELSLAPD